MTLKDLFKMTKADKYTADGCEELNKAREADVEDKVYQIGEISQKTGLQKTANGWVKPKSGKLNPADKKEERITKMQKETGKEAPYGRTLKGTPKTPDDDFRTERTKARAESKPAAGITILQGYKTKQLDETMAEHLTKNLDAYKGYQPYDMEELVLKPSGYEKQTSARVPGGGQSITYTKNGAEDITLFFDKNGELEMADVAGSKPAGTRHAEKRKTNRPKAIRWDRNNLNEMRGNEEYINAKAADNYYHQYGLDKIGEWKDRKGWTVKEYQNDDGETYRAKYNGEKYVGSEYDPTGVILSPENKDAAPRVLTGDCKIRVKK